MGKHLLGHSSLTSPGSTWRPAAVRGGNRDPDEPTATELAEVAAVFSCVDQPTPNCRALRTGSTLANLAQAPGSRGRRQADKLAGWATVCLEVRNERTSQVQVQIPAQPQSVLGDLGPDTLSQPHLPHGVGQKTKSSEPELFGGRAARKGEKDSTGWNLCIWR